MSDVTGKKPELEKLAKELARFLGQDPSLEILNTEQKTPMTYLVYFRSDLEWNPALTIMEDGRYALYADYSCYENKDDPMFSGFSTDTPVGMNREVQMPCPEPDGAKLDDIVKMATAMMGEQVHPVSVNGDTVRLWCCEFDTIGAAHLEARIEEDGVVALSIDGHGMKMRGKPEEILAERVSFSVTIAVTDQEEFDESFPNHTSSDGLLKTMLNCDMEAAGILNPEVTNIETEFADDEQTISFTVSADIPDPAKLTRAAREAYLGAWMDDGWVPSGPVEALYEYTLASNDNASPDDCGFAFEETPDSLKDENSLSLVSLTIEQEPEPEPAGLEI
jgi:hypothetical protein